MRQGDPGAAVRSFGIAELGAGVVDGDQVAAYEEHALVPIDVGPTQAQRLAFAHAGADHQLVQVGQQVVDVVAVAQEGAGFFVGPADELLAWETWQPYEAGGVVGQPAGANRLVERAG